MCLARIRGNLKFSMLRHEGFRLGLGGLDELVVGWSGVAGGASGG